MEHTIRIEFVITSSFVKVAHLILLIVKMGDATLMDKSYTMGQCRIVNKRPIYSGNLTLILRDKRDGTNQRRTTIFMKLFEQCPNHYAVLYRTEDCEFQYGFFDFKNCIVKDVPGNTCQFDVMKSGTDSGLRFETSCSGLAEKWMDLFRCAQQLPVFSKEPETELCKVASESAAP